MAEVEEKDDLRGDLVKAFAEVTPDPPFVEGDLGTQETPEAVETETAEQKAERKRDESGRFAKEPKDRPRETLKLKSVEKPPAPIKAGETPPAAKPPVDPNAKAEERVAPPSGWKGDEKVRWERLPPAVQAAIRREIDTHAERAQAAEPVMRVLDSQRDLLVREGGSVEGGVQKLMQISAWASGQPYDFLPAFIQQRGLNFPALAAKLGYQVVAGNGQQPQNQAQPQAYPPEILQRLQKIDQLEARIQGQAAASTQSEIDAFINDPAHPYVVDVQDEMIAHLEAQKRAGQRPNLKEAYDRAVWANPVTRAQLIASQQPAAPANQQAVEAARAAKAASLNGSPVPGAGKADDNEDLRSSIARQVYAQRGGQRV